MEQQGVSYRISLEDYFSKGIKDAESHAHSFEESLGEIKRTIAEITGIAVSFEFLKGASEKFIDSEKTARQLQFAVGMRGGLASDFQKLAEEAEHLQDTGIFEHDELDKTAASLLNFGISVKSVKQHLSKFADVAAEKNMTPEEVANIVATSSASGRGRGLYQFLGDKAPILEKGEEVDELGNKIKNAGAEARNFEKVMGAIGAAFKGGMEDVMTTDFGKIENIQLRFVKFKEDLGKGLTKAFVDAIPQMQKFIEGLTSVLHWVRENSNMLMGLAKAALYTFTVFKGIQYAVIGFGALKTMLMEVKVWMELVTAAEVTMADAMAITPWGAVAAGIGLVIAGYMALKGAADDANEAMKRQREEKENAWVEEEKRHIEDLIDTYLKLHKVTESVARQKVLEQEMSLFNPTAPYYSDEQFEAAKKAGTSQNAFFKDVTDKAAAVYPQIKKMYDEMKRMQLRSGGSETDLGSELSSPKASKIQNITINLNNPFQYAFQNMKSETPVTAMKDVGAQITEFLVSLVTDASIVATE